MHIQTPLLRSTPMSALAGCEVWLKMESSQPSGSFKMRGMGRAAQRAVEAGATRLVSSSGGNAGLAVACAGRALGVPVTVIVPSKTPVGMRDRIAAEGADVQVHGEAWDDAHARAIEVAAAGGALMHPFDHPDIWAGHSTLVHELVEEPDAVVVAVGGGGLLRGVLDGLTERAWSPTVYAAETFGTDSLARALEAGETVDRGSIEGIALTLGARRVAEGCRTRAAEWGVKSLRVTDLATVKACERFADDHRVLVEPACGAALACVYEGLVGPHRSILVVVCGGAAATRAHLEDWRALFS
jgi:L-serine/L-threonine ammonia-lyase